MYTWDKQSLFNGKLAYFCPHFLNSYLMTNDGNVSANWQSVLPPVGGNVGNVLAISRHLAPGNQAVQGWSLASLDTLPQMKTVIMEQIEDIIHNEGFYCNK